MELARLRRDVTVKATIQEMLTERLELARLDMVRDVPLVQVLDQPTVPTVPTGPHRLFNCLAGAIIALLVTALGLVIAFVVRQVVAAEKDQMAALQSELSQAKTSAGRMIRFRRRSVEKFATDKEETSP
jgi:uncharacterized protein involved in exopolysaccharide biosynthesis